jgi:hypothetical protein
MGMDKPTPLTDTQIRGFLSEFNSRVTKAELRVYVLQALLIEKGHLSEAEIAIAIDKADREAKQILEEIHDATRRGPSGGVQ